MSTGMGLTRAARLLVRGVGLAGALCIAANTVPALAAVPVEEQSTRIVAPPIEGELPGRLGESRTRPNPGGGPDSAPANVSGATLRPGQTAQLFFEVQQLRAELQRLQGVTEEQSHEIERLRRIQRDQYIDLDKRLSEFGPGGGTRSNDQAATNTRATTPARVVNGVVVDTPSVEPAPAAPSRNIEVAAVNPTVEVDNSALEKAGYDRAIEQMKARQFDESLNGFKQILDDYPDGEYAANSHYWLGELYLQKDDLAGARTQFLRVIEQYPAHQKVPDSLYKLGVVQHREGSIPKALEFFDDVVDRYPGAPAAGLARSYAAELR